MIDDNFDGDKILSEYESMSKDEVIDLLGTKYSEMLKQRLVKAILLLMNLHNFVMRHFLIILNKE